MKEKEKINMFIQYLLVSGKYESQADIGKKLGYDNKSSFSQLLKKEITSTFKEKFIKLFPEYEDFNINFEVSTEKKEVSIEKKEDQTKENEFISLPIEEKLNMIYSQNLKIQEKLEINKKALKTNEEKIEDIKQDNADRYKAALLFNRIYFDMLLENFNMRLENENKTTVEDIFEESSLS